MIAIQDDRISVVDGFFVAKCTCGKSRRFTLKGSALRMLNRGTCVNCKRDYRSATDDIGIYKKGDRWCKLCSGCGSEQAYTRKDHARQSFVSDWQCKKCVSAAKGFSENMPVGDKARMFNRFKKSALSRGLEWGLTIEDMYENYNGKCALTGWEISLSYSNNTASLDRIDSSIGYVLGNIQWVHVIVNMAKGKLTQGKFIDMCKSISSNFENNI